jgi:LmbE family N-acetylglucosaminyl deacetylase
VREVVRSRPDRVLALGAHPDDIEIGAGGLLARLAARGAEVLMVVCTIPSEFEVRRAEAHAGAATLGASLRILFDERPCRVENVAMYELVRRFDHIIADLRPGLVITHSANDLHWDHELVYRATVSALRRTPCDLLAYMSSPEMNALARCVGECFADITTTLDVKLAAIRRHTSQLANFDIDSSRDLARAMGRISGCEFAEAFQVLRIRI